MTTKVLPPDWGAMGEAAKLFTRSLMMGLDSAVRKNEFAELTAEDVENLPYAEAVEYLKKRDVIKKVDYNKLSDKMRFRAFTASRIADGDLLKRINSELIKNVNDGKGLKDFLSLTKTDILNKVGMGAGGQGWYWETVYRTNVQTAYNTGRMMGFEEDKPLALHFVGIEDSRQTDVCHSLSNVIRPYDDPLWEKYIPPLHFGCRSTVRAIYDEDELPDEWTSLEGIEKPAKGFGTNPLENDSWWNELSSQVARAKEYGVQGEIEAAGVALGVSQPSKEDLILKATQAIKQKREEMIPEPIYGYNELRPKEKRKAICNWLIRKGMISGKERFVIARPDGSLVAFKKGNKTNVLLGARIQTLLKNSEENRYIFYHNHPFSESFSFKDMRTLNYYNSLKEMVAIGHDGTLYSLKAGKRIADKDFIELFEEITEPEVLKELVKKYNWKYTVKRIV